MQDPLEGLMGGDPMVAMGLRPDPNAVEIEYTPRSPLVLPRDASQLPAPRQTATAYGADWPDDPDARARAQRAAERQAAYEASFQKPNETGTILSRQEMDEWARQAAGRGVAGVNSGYERADESASDAVSPRELLDRRKDPTQMSRQEPARQSLTEPPPGYRTPAVGADGQVAAQQAEPKKKSWFGRLF
ncbi:hypothetical protein N177_0019 [Lutibaculum baratangense AMV1]|uniref:Uncharacterized protein n=2 Tax=Lutibaculum TaxID=1358438 RepID=V4RND7_9HYPH|nr:hypothetical protein N177_0019 [Lutibaculum baratangense AMV1]